MTAREAQVVDAVLSTHARAYRNPEFVGSVLFPPVDVVSRYGKTLVFGIEAFRQYNLRRVPGARVARIGFGYTGDAYSLVMDSLDVPVPFEFLPGQVDRTTVPVDLGMRAADLAMRTITLALEREQAALATDANSYAVGNKTTLSGTSQWSDVTSNPIKAVADAGEAIRSKIGLRPNVGVIGAAVWPALRDHPEIVDRIKYTGREAPTEDIVARLLGLERLAVGGAITANDAGAFSDVWGKFMVLAYAPQSPSAMEQPSYGYTYRLSGHPFVSSPWQDNAVRSAIFGVQYERLAVLTGQAAGYLFSAVVP